MNTYALRSAVLVAAISLALSVAAIAAVVAGQSVFANNIPAADPGTQGEWSAPFDVGITAIHSVLLQNGKVLFWGKVQNSPAGNRAELWDPSGTLTDVSVPYDRDIFCAGESHLADGRLMVIGGHAFDGGGAVGVKQTDFFDPTTETWSPGPDMSQTRWYPDVIESSDGTILVIGGQHDPTSLTVEVERYDPATNAFTTLPPSANRAVGSYARTVVLPNGQVFMAGQNQDTDLLDMNTNKWRFVDNMNIGPRNNGLAVLLPGLNQVMAIGGAQADQTPATNTAEIIDFSVPTPTWQYSASMRFPRVQANAVLLPDGTVLVVGGCRQGLAKTPVNAAEVFDPVSQTWTVLASSVASKAHHSTALLLPDGAGVVGRR